VPAGLGGDCADGTLDGSYTAAQLAAALRHTAGDAGEYGDCRQAIVQATLAAAPAHKK
jgi:hypothetical protein